MSARYVGINAFGILASYAGNEWLCKAAKKIAFNLNCQSLKTFWITMKQKAFFCYKTKYMNWFLLKTFFSFNISTHNISENIYK